MLMILTPIMFDFRRVFGIGYFDTDNNYFNSYSDGTAGINLHLNFERLVDERYVINTFIETISTGDVVNYGISSIIIYYFNDNAPVNAESIQFGTPSSNYSVYRFFLNLLKHNNFTCYGTIEMSLKTGGVPVNDTISFQLTFIIPLGIEDYINLDLLIYVLFFFHFFLYVIIPVVLIWIFKPAFGLTLSEEDLKRDEIFMKYLRNQVNEKRKESEN